MPIANILVQGLGLEGVDIVIVIEDEFGIKIPDGDVERILTIGGMAQYVQHRLSGATVPSAESPCATMRTFHALRRTMIESAGVGRDEIRPDSNLRSLVPYSIRRQFWLTMERHGLRAPPLVISNRVQIAAIALSGLIGLFLSSGVLLYGWSVAVFVAWIPIACFFAIYALRRSDAFLPATCNTVADLARQTWLENRSDSVIQESASSDDGVMDRIKTIVAEELRIPKQSLHAETRFSDILP